MTAGVSGERIMPINFIVRWTPRPELRDKFLDVISRLGAAFTPEMARAIEFMRPTFNRQGQFVVLEVWKDQEALDRLRQSELFHNAIRDLSACCDKPLEIEHLYPDLGAMTPVFL
jgi:quinol monooxygenase YgiN